ncbi:asparagine synthase-domain-containing protein [Cantharellus anzutake]|uniref:asparagine synthase-domain-containing protein n=1 Tax=Cantharellus anzutake TaxID=1750568 RepID=UPI0019071819|nr:asparagine synthase-domain-containing protein [Cantharellus anzutake]KAF8331070.1 asparagine synthase-domain-containing protein [Cantharellus anzutake]
MTGPDSCRTLRRSVLTSEGVVWELDLFASVLHLRGDHIVDQPHENESGDVLCWNGEIFQGIPVNSEENDGSKLFQELTRAPGSDITAVFARLEGPYAFAFFQSSTRKLYFGRDPMGRRSLLTRAPTPNCPWYTIASTSLGPGSPSSESFDEVSAEHLYCIDLSVLSLHRARHSLNRCLPFEDKAKTTNARISDVYFDQFRETVDEFVRRLSEAVERQVTNIPPRSVGQARLAVLFSGGIDSAIVAFLAHRYLPLDEPIDLLNVAFENPRELENKKRARGNKPVDSLENIYLVPDRVTGFEGVEELRTLCPGRRWNFESSRTRSHVEDLMFPSRTVMDLSLALALYFASRGVGTIRDVVDPNASEGSGRKTRTVDYTCDARVLLSGLGSDELLGGYSRHKLSFMTGSWPALLDELQLDLDRLPSRNLGRDDRVISSNARETRYPFLDLSFVAFAASVPVFLKMDPTMDMNGVGDKLLLREAARSLGLVKAASRRKRAMQFGSRSARMTENAEERRGDTTLGSRTHRDNPKNSQAQVASGGS